MTHIDILKQALEALEESELTWKTDKAITSLEQAIAKAEKQEPVAWLNENESVDCYALSWYKNYTHTTPLYTYPQSKHFESQDWSLLEATQESLREHMARIKELEAQLATQPKQEQDLDYKAIGQQAYESGYTTGYMDGAIKAHEAKQEQGEPVAWVVYSSSENDIVWANKGKRLKQNTPLYTHSQPKREWVGLTHDEVPEKYRDDSVFVEGWLWAEAKLKEKNT